MVEPVMIPGRPLVELCPPEARSEALRILYRRIPGSLRERLVLDVLHEAESGQLDLTGLWIAWSQPWRFLPGRSRPRMIGALLTQALAGRAAGVWAPEVMPSLTRSSTASALVSAALCDFKARGFCIIQAVLDESASHRAAHDLTRGGMPRVTELLYLERDTQIPLPPSIVNKSGKGPFTAGSSWTDPDRLNAAATDLTCPTQLEWRPFEPVYQREFRELLKATYTSSLDMPELEGVRSLDDIIESHRATGRFVADRWQLGQIPGSPDIAVVLLLSEVADRNAWEVVYLGLTPAARGRGLGRVAIAHALEMARPHVSRLELAVDIRNLPATRLYESTGFVPFDRRSVHLVVYAENV